MAVPHPASTMTRGLEFHDTRGARAVAGGSRSATPPRDRSCGSRDRKHGASGAGRARTARRMDRGTGSCRPSQNLRQSFDQGDRSARRSCTADNVMRRRAVPSGTVGGRMAVTQIPRSHSASLAASARPRCRARLAGWESAKRSARCPPPAPGCESARCWRYSRSRRQALLIYQAQRHAGRTTRPRAGNAVV